MTAVTIRTINLWRVRAALAFVAEEYRFGMRPDWRKDAKAVGKWFLPRRVAVAPYSKSNR